MGPRTPAELKEKLYQRFIGVRDFAAKKLGQLDQVTWSHKYALSFDDCMDQIASSIWAKRDHELVSGGLYRNIVACLIHLPKKYGYAFLFMCFRVYWSEANANAVMLDLFDRMVGLDHDDDLVGSPHFWRRALVVMQDFAGEVTIKSLDAVAAEIESVYDKVDPVEKSVMDNIWNECQQKTINARSVWQITQITSHEIARRYYCHCPLSSMDTLKDWFGIYLSASLRGEGGYKVPFYTVLACARKIHAQTPFKRADIDAARRLANRISPKLYLTSDFTKRCLAALRTIDLNIVTVLSDDIARLASPVQKKVFRTQKK